MINNNNNKLDINLNNNKNLFDTDKNGYDIE
jgi:hypothetical protein